MSLCSLLSIMSYVILFPPCSSNPHLNFLLSFLSYIMMIQTYQKVCWLLPPPVYPTSHAFFTDELFSPSFQGPHSRLLCFSQCHQWSRGLRPQAETHLPQLPGPLLLEPSSSSISAEPQKPVSRGRGLQGGALRSHHALLTSLATLTLASDSSGIADGAAPCAFLLVPSQKAHLMILAIPWGQQASVPQFQEL